jgi:hypothetical protein
LEKIVGYNYTIDGFEDLDKFAKGILALVNIKSNRRKVIADFRTFEDTWIVEVITYDEMDDYLESYVGKISDKEKQIICEFDYNDLERSSKKVIENLEIEKPHNHTVIYFED